MADGGEFPVEDADDFGQGGVVDEVVDLVVTVHQGGAVARLGGWVLEECYHVPEMWDVADGALGVDVDGAGL